MKKIRLTKHSIQRVSERLQLPLNEIKKLFQNSIYVGEGTNGAELHKNNNITFVVKQHLGVTYHLITIYKDMTL